MTSSSSSSFSSCKYDVFLNFRGEDTRNNFISHLYGALCRKKIKTFIDEGLRRGDDISPALLNAIEGTKISVVIFSKDYASSKWCLNELVKILQCHQMNGQMVVPVFYHVDPSDVRKQNGSFGDAFVKHEKHFEDMPENVLNWRIALTQVSNLSGWASNKIRSEAELVDLIVRDILKKLENVMVSTYFDGFVGLYSRIEEIKSLLCIGSLDFRIVGIWGMGGIGKTTIAGVIFNQNFREFEGKCFLANVREESEKGGGLIYLRERVLSEILEENIKIGTPDVPECIKVRLRQMKVLIVLDDVNKVKQLQYLTGGLDRFGLGSRIIITTRDRRVLDNFGVCNTNIYKVKELDYHNALELFCSYAFEEKHCPSDLLALSERVLEYANGNPLALIVLGSFVRHKSKLDWEKALENLNRISESDIYDVLKISYNELQLEVKSMFLDIACFFAGEHRDFVMRILDHENFAHYGLNVLIEKSLITVSDSNQIKMHDLLQEMGREIVRQECVKNPGKRSRLWNHKDVYHVLNKNKGTDAIEGIFLNLSKITKDIHVDSRAFEKMPNLRLLKFYMPGCDGFPIMSSKVHLDQGLQYLPEELRYLHWHEYPLKTFPSNFELENLIELNLPYSKVQQLWKEEKEAPNLVSMDLHHSQYLNGIPEPSEIPNLQIINLSNCKSLSYYPPFHNLHNLSSPSLLSGFSTLVELNLTDCALMEIPQDIGFLSSLRSLYLGGNNFENLPTSIGCLSSLGWLDLHGNNLKSLPKSIGCLSSLYLLNISGNDFEGLPASMKQLSQLQYLYLLNCNMLQSLPELPLSLMSLIASSCKRLNNLESIPISIGCLSSLESLELHGSNLESLPANIGCLSSLWSLNLSVNNLKSLPTSIGCLSSLSTLDLHENNLESLPASIGCLSSLARLDLRGNKLESLPITIKQLSQLAYLDVSNCNMLRSLPELPSSLTSLFASNCKQLQSLPKVPSCPELDTSILETLSERNAYAPLPMSFKFTNCLKLNENANNILEDSQQIFQYMVIASLRPILKKETHVLLAASTLCLPGSKIPDWISHRSLFNSINIQLPLHCGNRNFIGFVVCVVIGGLNASDHTFVHCDYCFEIITPSETKHVRKKCALLVDKDVFFDLEHILLGFCPCWNVRLPDGDHHTTVSFQFSLESGLNQELRCCGVCPVILNPNQTKPATLTSKFVASSQEE